MTEAQKENLKKAREAAKAKREAARAEADAALLTEPAPPDDGTYPEPDPEAEKLERRRRLLGDNPEAWELVSDEELEEIERAAEADAREKQRKQVLADAKAAARHRAAVEYDLISADTLRSDAERARLAEPRTFTISLPGDGSGDPARGGKGIRIDGFLYEDGRTYTRPCAVFESLREIFYRTHLNEVTFRTLDQHKPGNSAVEVLSRTMPSFEVRHAG